jgi:prepilin-type processing-associated H-X9-DG protein
MTDYSKEEVRALLRDYLLGVLSESEAARVEQRVADNPTYAAWLEEDRQILAAVDALPHQPVSDELVRDTLTQVRQEANQASRPSSRRYAWTALAAACCVLLVAAILLPALARSRESARRASSQNNLKQMGLVFKMYANESKGERFPPLVSVDGAWVPDLRVLYPKYLTDPGALLDPANGDAVENLHTALNAAPPDWDAAHRILARNYNYLGLAMKTNEEFTRFTDDRTRIAKVEPDSDIRVGDDTFYRLREGIERFFITDINNPAASTQTQSEIPVLFENIARAKAEGRTHVNVLYLDGHVDSLRIGTFPATEEVAAAMGLPEQP